MLKWIEYVALWVAMLLGGKDVELVRHQHNLTWRKWRRLTLRIASLIISGETNQHYCATVIIRFGKLEQGVVAENLAKLTFV